MVVQVKILKMNKHLVELCAQLMIDTVTISQLKSNSNPNQPHFLYVIEKLEENVKVLAQKIETYPIEEIVEVVNFTETRFDDFELIQISYLRFYSFKPEYEEYLKNIPKNRMN